jgi:hypothetical protein
MIKGILTVLACLMLASCGMQRPAIHLPPPSTTDKIEAAYNAARASYELGVTFRLIPASAQAIIGPVLDQAERAVSIMREREAAGDPVGLLVEVNRARELLRSAARADPALPPPPE